MEKLKENSGFTLTETMLAMGLLAFIVLTILNGFTQQQLINRNTSHKAIAVSLAESKLEELLKFPASSLTIGSNTDYVVVKRGAVTVHDSEVVAPVQFKRDWSINAAGSLLEIKVQVHYGPVETNGSRPYSISLTSQRGV